MAENTTPVQLIGLLLELEDAFEQNGMTIAALRSDIDQSRVRYREAGFTPEMQGAMMMAAALRQEFGGHPLFEHFLKKDFLRVVTTMLAALR